ncbi:C-C motif chemokine 20-like [Dendropsophus ebraccatus]|uniref:C-C motif chemokine 20-like n=1 Tax=Dendropsophus ebraccatus TaxID=150705 RepID=UPI00383178C7
MSLIRSLGLLYILLLGFQSLTNAAVFDCCYTYTRKPLPMKAIKGYIMQNSSEVCDIDAVILITKKFRVCANPKDKWTANIITNLKKREEKIVKSLKKTQEVETVN